MIKRKIQIAAFLLIASCPALYSMDDDTNALELAQEFGWDIGPIGLEVRKGMQKLGTAYYHYQRKQRLQGKQLFFLAKMGETGAYLLSYYSKEDLKRYDSASFVEELKKPRCFEFALPLSDQYANFEKTTEDWPQTEAEIKHLFEELDNNPTQANVIELTVKERKIISSLFRSAKVDELINQFAYDDNIVL